MLAAMDSDQYHAVVYEWPLSRLLVWIEARAINHVLEKLKSAK